MVLLLWFETIPQTVPVALPRQLPNQSPAVPLINSLYTSQASHILSGCQSFYFTFGSFETTRCETVATETQWSSANNFSSNGISGERYCSSSLSWVLPSHSSTAAPRKSASEAGRAPRAGWALAGEGAPDTTPLPASQLRKLWVRLEGEGWRYANFPLH